jgi:SH3 domain protein
MPRRRLTAVVPLLCAALCTAGARAETLYVATELRAGMHQDKTLDSAIVRLLPAGTALEIIKKEDTLSFVREPGGLTGWIDNSYLSSVAGGNPDSARLQERADTLEKRLGDANKEIADLEMQLTQSAPNDAARQYQAMRKQATELDRELRDERLKSGELQAEVSELKKRLGQNGSSTELHARIEQLVAENKRLESALAGNGAVLPLPAAATTAAAADTGWWDDRRRQLYAALAVLVLGFGGGVYLMDWLNRRRHGGFRV